MRKEPDNQYSEPETEERLRNILRGAFSGPPTQLKEVPTRHGKLRRVKKTSSALRATAKPFRLKAKIMLKVVDDR